MCSCSFWSFLSLIPPLPRADAQECSGVGTPHTVARFGPIWPDSLVAARLEWARVASFGSLVASSGVRRSSKTFNFLSFPIIPTVDAGNGGSTLILTFSPQGRRDLSLRGNLACERRMQTMVGVGAAVAQWAFVVGWEARPQTGMRGSRLRGNDGFMEHLFSNGYTLLTPAGVSATILRAWWLERSGTTRSHPEHGSETLQRRRYW